MAESIQMELEGMPLGKRNENWEEFKRMVEANEREGMLMPRGTVHLTLGVSHERVRQLIAEGTFRTWKFYGRDYLSGQEIAEFLKLERKAGRPWKEPSIKEVWRGARDLMRKQREERRKNRRK